MTRSLEPRRTVALFKAQGGFGYFELFWILLMFILSTVAIRFGSWILGVQLGWGVCILFGVIAPMALMMLIGVVVSMRQSPQDDVIVEECSTSNANFKATSPFKSTSGGKADQCVRILQHKEGQRRVRIFLRYTGTFYFQEEYFSEHPLEQCWIPISGRGVGIYDSEQTALREAKASIDWLIAEYQ